MHRVEITTTAPSAPLPMNAMWRTIRRYILWQYERGTLHYDIMVTLIILFFVVLAEGDQLQRQTHCAQSASDGCGCIGRRRGPSSLPGRSQRDFAGDDQSVREQLLQIIEPISGAVSIVSYEPFPTPKDRCRATRYWPSGTDQITN